MRENVTEKAETVRRAGSVEEFARTEGSSRREVWSR